MTDSPRVRTITDLAALAGVSAGTVSRALAGSSLIARTTRERIRSLAREHGFRPNAVAQNLRLRRTGAIAVMIPLGHEIGQHVSDPFFLVLLGHLADALTERGYDVLLSRVVPADPDWLSAMVDSGRVDGVILIGQSDQSRVIDEVAARYNPLVAWGAHGDGQVHCSVGTDNRLGGRLAAEHLLERGARGLAFLGDPVAPEIAQRLEGAREAVSRFGDGASLAVVPTPLTGEAAYRTVSHWLSTGVDGVDGLIAASDVIALAALRSLSERGRRVPRTMRVVGYDDVPLASQSIPPLTTIRQDLALAAFHLVDLLLKRIAGERTDGVVLEPWLVARGSS